MVVVSEPRKVLVGEGQNAKYVKECKEVFLGNKGIEKIRGFEDFVNLEVVCLNGNKLKKINNLEACTRVKIVYAQDNQICTLKGSLSSFTFLETLDLSNNQLRDLAKLIPVLQKFQFLNNLNLKDNPCCEEPDYRLQLVHAMPGLKVLDQHVITTLERNKAKANIGGDVQALTVAFGKRAPLRDPAWDQKVPERSLLEYELSKEAAAARDAKLIREQTKELLQFSHNPHPDIPRGQSLPPNAGTRRAMATWRKTSEDGEGGGAASSSGGSGGEGVRGTVGRGGRGKGSGGGGGGGGSDGGEAYQPKDVFVLYSSRAKANELYSTFAGGGGSPTATGQHGGQAGGMYASGGSIELEAKKYETFVNRKTAGTLGQWELEKKTLRV